MFGRPLFILLMLSVLSACSSANRPAPVSETGARRIALTSAQSKLVEDGVKEMMESPGAQLSAVTAISMAQQPGIHVCGYVKSPGAAGKEGPDLPFYVELREADGKPVTERGQVGSDPSKISKIKFVCRRNG